MAQTITDQELKMATDIAYLDLEVLKENQLKPNREEAYSVGELLKVDMDGEGEPNVTQEHLDSLTANCDTLGDENISLNLNKVNQLSKEALNWKIVDTFNDNNRDGTGFYGAVIDTGEGLIVSFRGSESPTELQNIQQDWIGADLALIEGKLTDQQKSVNRFMDDLKAKGYFEKYENIYFAGHSLGGNHAEHATFYAAKIGVADKIDRTISYDGPGHSLEYIEAYKKYIEMATSQVSMLHVEQSVVGGLLNPIDGIKYIYAKLKGEGPVQHGTENVTFDKDGNIVTDTNQTLLAKIFTPFTQGLDRLLGQRGGTVLVNALLGITTVGAYIKGKIMDENGNLTTAGKFIVTGLGIGLTAMVVKLGPVGMAVATIGFAKIAVTFLAAVVIFTGAVIAYDFIMDHLEAFVEQAMTVYIPQMINSLAVALARFVNWSEKQLVELGNLLVAGYRALVEGWNNLFGSGVKAVATPYIKVDTFKLRQYAERLETVKSRLATVDSNLNILYFAEGLLDIINLAIAEHLPSKRQMNKVINYLHDTAGDFEAAEFRIMNV